MHSRCRGPHKLVEMSESQCTRWLSALGKKVIRRETLPAGVQLLADRAILAAGRDWSSREAGRTIAGELVAVCWEHILHPLESGHARRRP